MCQQSSSVIELIESHVVYENPKPMLRSRHGYFPGIVELPSGELLALVVIGEAFEAVDLTTHVAAVDRRRPDLDAAGAAARRVARRASRRATSSSRWCLRDGSLDRARLSLPSRRSGAADRDRARPTARCPATTSSRSRRMTAGRGRRRGVIPRRTPELVEIPVAADPAARRATSSRRAGCSRCPTARTRAASSACCSAAATAAGRGTTATRYFDTPGHSVAAYESHVAEMQPGRLVAICWAFEHRRRDAT